MATISKADRIEYTRQYMASVVPDSVLVPLVCTCSERPYPHPAHTEDEAILSTTETCGKIVKHLFGVGPCLRPLFHDGGCNPFSDTPLGGKPKKGENKSEVLKPTVQPGDNAVQDMSALPSAQKPVDERPLSNETQCLWSGPSGRCIKRAGHYPATPHIEATPDAFS